MRQTPQEIRKKVTDMMISSIEQNVMPWRAPWAGSPNVGVPCNFHTKRRYTGINPLILIFSGMAMGYESRHWGTYNSWVKHLGAHVRKGETGTHIVLFKWLPQRDPQTREVLKDSNGRDKGFPYLTEYVVFNCDQIQAPDVSVLLDGRCKAGKWGSFVRTLLAPDSKAARPNVTTLAELQTLADTYVPKALMPKEGKPTREQLAQLVHDGIDAKLDNYRAKPVEDRNADPDFGPAEEFIVATQADIRHGGAKAFYRPSADFIQLPPKRSFDTMSNYYGTAFHELVHWTEKDGRVGRKEGHEYAFGELVAEIGACFLLMELGIPLADEMTAHSRGYVKEWLKGMKDDTVVGGVSKGSKFIFDAATQAGKAVDYLLSFVGKQNPAYEEDEESGSAEPDDQRRVA